LRLIWRTTNGRVCGLGGRMHFFKNTLSLHVIITLHINALYLKRGPLLRAGSHKYKYIYKWTRRAPNRLILVGSRWINKYTLTNISSGAVRHTQTTFTHCPRKKKCVICLSTNLTRRRVTKILSNIFKENLHCIVAF